MGWTWSCQAGFYWAIVGHYGPNCIIGLKEPSTMDLVLSPQVVLNQPSIHGPIMDRLHAPVQLFLTFSILKCDCMDSIQDHIYENWEACMHHIFIIKILFLNIYLVVIYNWWYGWWFRTVGSFYCLNRLVWFFKYRTN